MREIMKPFRSYPKEAAIIGRMLAGYGELEFLLHLVLTEILGNANTSGRVMFRSRGEEHRLSTADALIRPTMETYSLLESWDRVRRAMFWCKTTRNQYAHCHWLDDVGHGLMFTRIETAAKTVTGDLILPFFHIDVPLLKRQEEHFHYTDMGLCYLRGEMKIRRGQIPSHPFSAPQEKQAPPRHNPQKEHPIRSRETVEKPPK
jgi:hypothetical protein